MIFDDQWQGAEAVSTYIFSGVCPNNISSFQDDIIIAQEQREAEEKARNLKAEREAAARRERERLDREEQERAAQKEREQSEKDRKEQAAARGGVRGVRGTRASMRATRGTRASEWIPFKSQLLLGSQRLASSFRPPTASAGAGSTSSSAPRGSSTTRGLGRRT